MKAENFEQLERILNVHMGEELSMTAREFVVWLDKHGYKTYPEAPDYVD